jgi:hypothetical protein
MPVYISVELYHHRWTKSSSFLSLVFCHWSLESYKLACYKLFLLSYLPISSAPKAPEGKVRQNWTTFSSPGFGIANFSFLAGKTSYLLITKLGLLTIKMLVLPRLSNFVQFHWTPFTPLLLKLLNLL